MSNKEVLEDALKVARSLGHVPTTTEQKEHGTISPVTFYRRFGSWKRVKERVRKMMREGKGKSNLEGEQKGKRQRSLDDVPRLKAKYISPKDLISIADAARLRGVANITVRSWVTAGSLRPVTIAGRPFLLRSEVESFKVSRRAKVRAMSDEEVLRGVVRLARRLKGVPSTAEYVKYKGPDEVVIRTLYNRYGSWPEVAKAVSAQLRVRKKN